MIELECINLEKKYFNKLVFRGINLKLKDGDAVAITGKNGSGKSTFLKIISGLIKPTSGKIILKENNNEINRENYINYIGFTSPYINLYDELTAFENLKFFSDLINDSNNQKDKINSLLKRVNLYNVRNELVRDFSTGMKQRLKLAFSLLKTPKILLLDEPQSNLDSEGIELINNIFVEQKNRGILIIATNELWDTNLFSITLNIENYK